MIYSSAKPTVVFLTVCTRGRAKWLADDQVHDHVLTAWGSASGWRVGRYVLMPDHVHLFAGWVGGRWTLEQWTRYWKAIFSRIHRNPDHRWQTDHWDTRMKSRNQFEAKWEYVRNNPVRHNLVARAEEWPYSGIVCEFGPW